MVAVAHDNASFIDVSKGCSCVGAHIFLSEDDPAPRPNGLILIIAHIIKSIISSVVESPELRGLFITTRAMVPLRNTPTEINWHQPKLHIQTNNSTAAGFTKNAIETKVIKSTDMRFHWLHCHKSQG